MHNSYSNDDMERKKLMLVNDYVGEIINFLQSIAKPGEPPKVDPEAARREAVKLIESVWNPQATEQEIRRRADARLNEIKESRRAIMTMDPASQAEEMIASLPELKELLKRSFANANSKNQFEKAVGILERIQRDATGKIVLDPQQTAIVPKIYCNIFVRFKLQRGRQKQQQQMQAPQAQQHPQRRQPPVGMPPQGMPSQGMPSPQPVSSPKQQPPPQHMQPHPVQHQPPPPHPPGHPPPPPPPPQHVPGYPGAVHPQQVRKPEAPATPNCDDFLTRLFKFVRNDTAVFYSTPHPPHF